DSLFVENSILHSECVAENDIVCDRGNVIGGSVSAGGKIAAKDFGNRMHTKSFVTFGVDQQLMNELTKLEKERDGLVDNIKKLHVPQEKLEESKVETSAKTRVTLLRLKNSLVKSEEQLGEVEE